MLSSFRQFVTWSKISIHHDVKSRHVIKLKLDICLNLRPQVYSSKLGSKRCGESAEMYMSIIIIMIKMYQYPVSLITWLTDIVCLTVHFIIFNCTYSVDSYCNIFCPISLIPIKKIIPNPLYDDGTGYCYRHNPTVRLKKKINVM